MELLDDGIDPRLQVKLDALQEVPPRQQQAAASGRASFLAQAQSMAAGASFMPPVSPVGERRPIGWIEKIDTLFGRKERSPMFTTFVSILVVASLLLGGGGAAVFAAQASLPGEALYGVKTVGEDLRLDLSGGTQAGLALELAYAGRRIDEMRSLAEKGEPVPETVAARYQQQMEKAYQLCAGMGDAALQPALEQVRQRLQEQERRLQTGGAQGDPQAQEALARVREQIRQQLRLVEAGMRNPQGFRRQVQAGAAFGPGPVATPPAQDGEGSVYGPGGQNGPGDGSCEDCDGTPAQDGTGEQHGAGDGSCEDCDGTPAHDRTGEQHGPGGQSSPGDGSCEDCDGTPAQDGTGEQNGNGQNGPGDGSCEDCEHTPTQDGTGEQYGSGDQSGPGDGSGSGSGDPGGEAGCDDCGEGSHPSEGGDHESGGGHGGGGGGRP